MELSKSYKGLVIWVIVYTVALISLSFLKTEDEALLIRIMMNMTSVGIAVLAYMIYRTGRVYWYSGVEYEAAVQAGSERRKEYARKHFVRFANTAGLYFAYTLISYLLKLHYGVDIAVAIFSLVGAAFSTMKFKL